MENVHVLYLKQQDKFLFREIILHEIVKTSYKIVVKAVLGK